MKKFFKRFFRIVLLLLLVVNGYIIFSGRTYIYKGLANTYLVGETHPQIDEHDIFINAKVTTANPKPWAAHEKLGTLTLSDSAVAHNTTLRTTGFVVIQNDALLFEEYWDGFDDASVTNSFSAAKSIVAVLTGIAMTEGKISLFDSVATYLPEYANDPKGHNTVKDLLTMSSNLAWHESGGNPLSHNAEAYYGTDLKGLIDGLETEGEAGKEFLYKSGNTQLLGFVLEAAIGQSLNQYASEKLWGPIGAEHEALWNLDDVGGDEKAYCCYYATARDFARVGQLLLNDGRWNGNVIIDERIVKSMRHYNGLPDAKNGEMQPKYGYSWWLEQYNGMELYYARGLYGQYIIVLPEYNAVAVRIGHERLSVNERGHPADFYHWVDAAVGLLEAAE